MKKGMNDGENSEGSKKKSSVLPSLLYSQS